MQPTGRIIYEFGPFRLDPQRHTLSRDGSPVPLAPKAFEILELLLQRHDTLISKSDLLAHIWPDSFVEENNLAQHVSQLRKTLGAGDDKSQYIQTVPRIGYRFNGQVRLIESGSVQESRVQSLLIAPPAESASSARRGLAILAICLGALLLGVLVVFLLWPKPAPAVVDYIQLTHDGFPKRGPLMTDGEFVYFTEDRDGSTSLVRLPVAGGEPAVLPDLPASLQPLALSGKRREILLLGPGPTDASLPLYAWDLLHGRVRRIGTVVADSGTWSADGSRVVYSRAGSLYVVNADGTDSRELVKVPGLASWLAASPDGRFLTLKMQRESSSMEELWQLRLSDAQLQRVSSGVSSELRYPLGTWTRDSRYFLFSEAAGARFTVWAVRHSSGPGLATRARINTGLLNVTDLANAAERERLLAIGAQSRMEILRYDAHTRSLTPYLHGVSADGLAFSRAGDWVAYTTYPDRKLFRSRPDGSQLRLMTPETLAALLPSWSPDGTRLAFMGRTGTRAWKIYLVARDAGAPEELMPGPDDQGTPTWAPDGRSLIYAGVPWAKGFASNSTAVYLVELGKRTVTTLPESGGLWSPRWSPDGRFVVAESMDSRRLLLFDFSTKAWALLATVTDASIGYTSWSRDSRYVYFNSYFHQRGAIFRVKALDHRVERLELPHQPGMAVTLGQWFTLGPDDSPLFLKDTGVHEVYALDLRLP